MVSTFTPNKRIEKPAHNDYIDSWEIPVNADWSIIDLSFGGAVTKNLTGLSGNQTLATAEYQPLKIILSGAPAGNVNVVTPAGVGGLWVVRNNTTGGFVISISSAPGGTTVVIPVGTNTLVTCDGTATGMFYAINTPPAAAGANTQVQYNSSGLLAGAVGLTWDGTKVTTIGLSNTGNTVLGDAAGDTLSIGGTAISTPNGATFNTNQLILGGSPFNQVAIGTTAVAGTMLTVGGVIRSTAGGYIFPDGTNQTSATTIPAGCIMAYAGPAIPSGWFHCFGQTLSRTTWPALFAALGGAASPYGLPDANTFNLPDLRGRVIAEIDGGSGRLRDAYFPGGVSSTVGQAGGQDAVQYNTFITELFVRVGYWDSPAQNSTGYCSGDLALSGTTGGESHNTGGVAFGGDGVFADSHTHAVGGTASGSLNLYPPSFGAYGTTDAVDRATDIRTNVQPTMVMYWIIKA